MISFGETNFIKFGYKLLFDTKGLQRKCEDLTTICLEYAPQDQLLSYLDGLRVDRHFLIEMSIIAKGHPFFSKRNDALLEITNIQIKRVEETIREVETKK